MMSETNKYPFTASQWQELEQQALIFKYMMSGLPITPELLHTINRTLPFTSRLFPNQSRGYDIEEKAAKAYDLAAIKYWGSLTHTKFPLENYQKETEEMKNMSRQEFVAHLRKKVAASQEELRCIEVSQGITNMEDGKLGLAGSP